MEVIELKGKVVELKLNLPSNVKAGFLIVTTCLRVNFLIFLACLILFFSKLNISNLVLVV